MFHQEFDNVEAAFGACSLSGIVTVHLRIGFKKNADTSQFVGTTKVNVNS